MPENALDRIMYHVMGDNTLLRACDGLHHASITHDGQFVIFTGALYERKLHLSDIRLLAAIDQPRLRFRGPLATTFQPLAFPDLFHRSCLGWCENAS